MDSLLSGLRVLDFTALLPGPFATLQLADLGAEVLCIESPSRIDGMRLSSPYVNQEEKISSIYAFLNRNKRFLSLDLKKEGSFSIIERLIQGYDIVVEQFRPGVMDRLGLSYKKFAEINHRIIYCSITGYGQSGPLKDKAGHDVNYLSHSGVMGYSGRKDSGPVLMGIQVSDILAGSNNAVIAILAAVINKIRTGKGQYIDISITDGMFPCHAISGIKELNRQDSVDYESEMLNGGSIYDFYETADGRHISIAAIEPQFFNNLCDVLGLKGVNIKDALRSSDNNEIKRQIAEIIKSKTGDYWIEKFKGVDACVDIVLNLREALESDHVKERGLLVDVPGPYSEALRQFACPMKFSDFNPKYKRYGCAPGEDTLEILKSLNFDDNEIREFKEQGVIGLKQN